MPVNLKLDYVDELVVVENGVTAEEKQGSLFVYDKDEKIVARFSGSEVKHWWTGSTRKSEAF